MGNTNFTIDVKFQEAKNKAQAMAQEVINMEEILNVLDDELKGMTWDGAKAADFKRRIDEAKVELDNIYKEYVIKIPEVAETSIRNYLKEEES